MGLDRGVWELKIGFGGWMVRRMEDEEWMVLRVASLMYVGYFTVRSRESFEVGFWRLCVLGIVWELSSSGCAAANSEGFHWWTGSLFINVSITLIVGLSYTIMTLIHFIQSRLSNIGIISSTKAH